MNLPPPGSLPETDAQEPAAGDAWQPGPETTLDRPPWQPMSEDAVLQHIAAERDAYFDINLEVRSSFLADAAAVVDGLPGAKRQA